MPARAAVEPDGPAVRVRITPWPVSTFPSVRTLWISQSGASERMMPAHAVPWPKQVARVVLADARLAVLAELDDHRPVDAANARVRAVDTAANSSRRWRAATTQHRGFQE